CIAEDSGEVVIEEMEYTFESELLWSYDLTSFPRQDLTPEGYNSISKNGNFVALRAGGVFNSFRGGALFYRGNLIYSSFENPRIDNISVSHNGQFAIVPIYYEDWESPNRIICVDTLGDTVWECRKAYTSYGKAFVSWNDSFLACIDGRTREWHWHNIFIFMPWRSNHTVILNAQTGEVIDSLNENLAGYITDVRFTGDMKFVYFMYFDSLAIYDGYFNYINSAFPLFNCPPKDSLSYLSFPYYDISKFDNNIYVYLPFAFDTVKGTMPEDFWIYNPDGEFIIQAVCLDSFGNIIWRKNTDGLKVGRFQMSCSGRYTLGYTDENCPIKQVALWKTQTNELLFYRNFPQDTSYEAKWSKWCDIYENPENDHILIKVTTQDTTIYLHSNGADANVDLQGITLFPDNPVFGYRKDGNIFKLFRVRW
ncbi:hypothetical protein DRQ29_04450, partial [bacterium]